MKLMLWNGDVLRKVSLSVTDLVGRNLLERSHILLCPRLHSTAPTSNVPAYTRRVELGALLLVYFLIKVKAGVFTLRPFSPPSQKFFKKKLIKNQTKLKLIK